MARRKTDVVEAPSRAQPSGGGDQVTREKVIDAAVHCILDLGFYRASSNAIARQAGVTWGVIQHYFGTREKLMLEVLQRGTQHFIQSISEGTIDGETTQERLDQLIDILSRYYGQPEYVAYVQVLLNLDHDPRTSVMIRQTMADAGRQTTEHIRRLLCDALGAQSQIDSVVFHAVRGFLLSQQLRAVMSYDTTGAGGGDVAAERELLAAMLTPYIESLD